MNPNLTRYPAARLVVGALVFMVPFLSLITWSGVSAASFLLLIAACLTFKPAMAALRSHWRPAAPVVLAFLAQFLFALCCLALRRGEYLNLLERPLRMFLAVSALMLVLRFKPDRRSFWFGVFAGAAGAVLFVAYQRLGLGVERPGGLINAITFGDLALLLGLLSLASAIDLRNSGRAVLPALGALAGIAASILSGTRGAWIALALTAVLFIRYSHVLSSKRVRAVVVASFVLALATLFVPGTGMRARVEQGVHDIAAYFDGGSAMSNMGIRLELWKGAALMITDHPFIGQSVKGYRASMKRYVEEGRLDPVVLPMPHVHNDALQALVTGGLIGFAIWAATLIAPLVFFGRLLGRRDSGKQTFALALAGMMVVVSYFSFGLTEVIFWSMMGSLFYALLVFVLMGLCLNAKETDGK